MSGAETVLIPPEGAVPPVRHPEAPRPGEPLPSHYEQCFACGDGVPHGLGLRSWAGDGVSVRAELTVLPAHQGAPGLAHGGILSAALDETLGSLNWVLRTIAVTGRLETDFLRPVPVGTRLCLRAEATAVHGRKIYATAEGRVGDPEGALAVRARALFVEVTTDHFTTHGRDEEIEAALADPRQREVVRTLRGDDTPEARS